MVDLAARFDHYRARFREAMDARDLTNEAMAERMGAHSVTISKLRGGRINLDDEWRAKAAVALGLPEPILFGDDILPPPLPHEMYVSPKRAARRNRAANDNLPHYGLAAGSLVGAGALSSELPEEVPCPPGLRNVAGAYALTTKGESMIPRFFPGERLFINPMQRVQPGDFVIIQTAKDDGPETETWVKRFDAEDKADIWVSQYNPPARIAFKKKYVRYVHRVVPVNELF